MKSRLLLLGVLVILAALAVFVFIFGMAPGAAPANGSYEVTSLVDYDSHLCGSTTYGNAMNGFNTGVKLSMKDKNTGEGLNGSSTLDSRLGGGSLGSAYYSCEEGVSSGSSAISAYSEGYTPIAFGFDLPKNQLATIQVQMMRSCTGGPSCLDNIRTQYSALGLNQTGIEDMVNGTQERFYAMIKYGLGLNSSDYELDCMECDMGRGGYVKGNGTYKDGSPFQFFYHWGWCSSGGTDCGWGLCFSSSSASLFQSVKDDACGKVSSFQRNDGSICSGEAYDNTTQARDGCSAGGFETVNGNVRALSIAQTSNRCDSFASAGDFDCMQG